MNRREDREEKALNYLEEIIDDPMSPQRHRLQAAKAMLGVTSPRIRSVDVRMMSHTTINYVSPQMLAEQALGISSSPALPSPQDEPIEADYEEFGQNKD